VGLEPVNVNIDRMINMFRLGVTELGDLLKEILRDESLTALEEISRKDPFVFNDDLWACIIYDYALAWQRKIMKGEHILRTITPLYLGKVASLVIEMAESSADEVEARLEALSFSFERLKPYLLERW
jgi:hypothetical protein